MIQLLSCSFGNKQQSLTKYGLHRLFDTRCRIEVDYKYIMKRKFKQ